MDKKQTPNHLKPLGFPPKHGSGSKFAHPRSRPKLDANTTIAGHSSHNMSVMGSTRSLNRTGRHNFDATFASTSSPNIKSNIGSSVNFNELEYDLAYNNYLQALLKQQLVKKTIEDHKVKLNDQILIQSEHLHKLEDTYSDITNKIDGLKEENNIIELLQMLKWGITEIETLCSRYNTFDRLIDLNRILTMKSNLISIKNIKPLHSQEEYNTLVSSIINLKNVLQKIVEGERHFKEVNELASSLKEFNELNEAIDKAVQELNMSNESAAVLLLKEASDLFAEQGGYF